MTEPNPADDDSGRALIEVVVLAVLILIPTTYLLIALFRVQAATYAVTQAARDTGRLIETSRTIDEALTLAEHAATTSLNDQGVPTDTLTITFTPAGAPCDATPITPHQTPGATYTVCVTATLTLPGVPGFLTGSNNTTTAAYTIHINELREHDPGTG